MTDTDQPTITVHYTDAGILLTWPSDQPDRRHALHVPIDEAPGLAYALERIVDGEVDYGTKHFVVQWYGGPVLLTYQPDDAEPERWQLPMATTAVLAAAIRRAIDDRDGMISDGDDIGGMTPDDFR
ncbi:hypothetical protein CIW52_06435 [Mycolicibacterium sp. P9-64]|uniref:hypothetical protein n=1 Tax=Mycolicibacterium sp. P9-64 TaxID=2024612 RepID=UPI0011ECD17F|nr:hypothetical protein [Mycolicibacterium sp. P9-64]KAA0085533.1 hypothetical protein CIW52_06435 [Mycolicibacterium sp. P9-64]